MMASDNLLAIVLSTVNIGFLLLAVLFTYESVREQEPRAPKIGATGVAVHLLLGFLIVAWPPVRVPLAWMFGLALAVFGLFLIPLRRDARSLKGAKGYLADGGDGFTRMDERDIMFARNRCLIPGSEVYDRYYEMHPEHKAYDDARRTRGGPLGKPGSIDGSYRPNVSMLVSAFELPNMLGQKARVSPGAAAAQSTYASRTKTPPPADMDPETATRIIKGWARHLGADLVGVCRIDPRWTYSHKGEIHYGEWDEWGKEIPAPLPYAVVVATAMDHDLVTTAPHTPSVVESGYNYARGAYITTILAQWLGTMGYCAVAEHNRHYDTLLVPMAIDAGLGELGRQGYLIAEKYGPRVRLFAVQTDMPLVPDAPIDLGAERFCEACLKCADSCPSKSIPRNKTVERGMLRWKLNEETCFDYWGKIGTDCCVCMAVCPFARPHRTIHRLVKTMLRRSELSRWVFPCVDNLIYGKRWKPRKAPYWIAYPKGASSKGVPSVGGDA